jgi:hypothetical protein
MERITAFPVKKERDFRSRMRSNAIEWKVFHSEVSASVPGT